jgi:DNA-binding Lrp family transcriptional regulator
MKDIELKLLSQLMKNSRRSDRDLAKAVGTSQPTITRTRQRLEKEEIIKDYTMIPDFGKLGIEIVAFTFGVWVPEMLKSDPENERIEKANKFILEHPNVVFASSGRGLGMGRIIVTVHKDYADYNEFMQQAEYEWAGFLAKLESFTISLKSDAVLMPLFLRNLMEYVMKTE